MAQVNPGSGPMTGLAGAVTADRRVSERCPLGTGGARGAVWISSSGGFAVYSTGGANSTAAGRPSAERTGPREAENFCSHTQQHTLSLRLVKNSLTGFTVANSSEPPRGLLRRLVSLFLRGH